MKIDLKYINTTTKQNHNQYFPTGEKTNLIGLSQIWKCDYSLVVFEDLVTDRFSWESLLPVVHDRLNMVDLQDCHGKTTPQHWTTYLLANYT